jgi:hypothetical protein
MFIFSFLLVVVLSNGIQTDNSYIVANPLSVTFERLAKEFLIL